MNITEINTGDIVTFNSAARSAYSKEWRGKPLIVARKGVFDMFGKVFIIPIDVKTKRELTLGRWADAKLVKKFAHTVGQQVDEKLLAFRS